MKIEFLHNTSDRFPPVARKTNWDAAQLAPLGIIDRGDDTEVFAMSADRKCFAIGEGGEVALDDVGDAFYDALERLCHGVWGHRWHMAVADIFGITRRTTQRDRVTKSLMSPFMIQSLTYIATDETPGTYGRELETFGRIQASANEEYANELWQAAAEMVRRFSPADLHQAFEVLDERIAVEGGDIAKATAKFLVAPEFFGPEAPALRK